jgi:hypothetical protein
MSRPRGAIYRRCPSCQTVHRASIFRRAHIPFNVPGRLQRRQCPVCGRVDLLAGFSIAERPESDQGDPT